MTRPGRLAAPTVLADGRRLSGAMLRRLFVGQCLVLALHLAWMPAWFAGVAVAVAAYRYRQLRRDRPRAGLLLRLAAVGALVLALWAEFGGLGGMRALIGLLLGVYLLKLLETHDRRDARVVVMIGLVAIGVAFLHDQGVPLALGALAALAWQLQALAWLSGARETRQAWGETAWLLGLSAPLMLGLFLVAPRLPPLWQMPETPRASTGLSDSIAPGDIAELSRSDARAFRADFRGRVPPPGERYWRVYTLSHFDGARWTRVTPPQLSATLGLPVSRFVRRGRASAWGPAGEAPRYRYELLLEPDSRPWRPSLGAPRRADRALRFLVDGTVEGLAPLRTRELLTLASSGAPPRHPDPAGPGWHSLLPADANPRTRALARRLWQQGGGEPEAYLAAVLARFGEAPYRYTLSPPRLRGEDRVDAFLFESRAGYCTHYASATAVMARMAGIPARIVAGFLGGERHPDGHLTVRDYDAHAWVEVWREGAWRRLDPTAAIAPARVERGAAAVAEGREAFLADAPLSPLRLRDIGWANRLRLGWERLEYRWQRGVIGYREEARDRLVAGLLDRLQAALAALLALGPWRGLGLAGLGLLGGAALGLGVAAGLRRWPRGRDERRRLAALQAWLARRGHPCRPGESPAAHLRRLIPEAGAAGPALAAAAAELEALYYAPLSPAERRGRRRALRRQLRRVRRDWRRGVRRGIVAGQSASTRHEHP
ncbi:transglutaminase family protein [Halomonas koreensis]|uniref:DUF3488 and transglutaminase-like domain-containing protein n=1 Tax=Halomonas koreensis TaxID=245385 RepID=A0ABU1FYE6_9GAMM|nr:DUF3488 and transglutaminase-like domain-containing protein [Halomonas koreensis]MDR5865298.1 DUF3488 and transglutaminase-like domain-containing protein [Halomonas koreensis]